MRSKSFVTVAALILLAGCVGGETTLTTTGPKVPSRGEHCDFQVLTADPSAGFVELGTVDVEPGNWGRNIYTNLAEFKEHIAPYVCAAGGDAAVALANGYGMYIKATILKTTGAPPAASVPAGSAAGGCQFDTQCKGDRVCVKGECVDPAKK
jgi:hypothetical protein